MRGGSPAFGGSATPALALTKRPSGSYENVSDPRRTRRSAPDECAHEITRAKGSGHPPLSTDLSHCHGCKDRPERETRDRANCELEVERRQEDQTRADEEGSW